jgi:hypothetical protein
MYSRLIFLNTLHASAEPLAATRDRFLPIYTWLLEYLAHPFISDTYNLFKRKLALYEAVSYQPQEVHGPEFVLIRNVLHS